jgi:hypothetical protein
MHNELHLQANRNGKTDLTVPELMTIYLFGQINGYFKHRHIYNFIKEYWLDWFPNLPSYQAFNCRLNLLEPCFHALFENLSNRLHAGEKDFQAVDYLIDSMPIMLAVGTRSKQAKVAHDLCNTGTSFVKQTHFHGVRLHLLAKKKSNKLPLPNQVWLKQASVHDLTALKEKADELPNFINLFGDKADADALFKEELQMQNIQLFTPIKKPKKKELSEAQRRYNKTVSKIRQPIESFFKWLIDKTDIQRASQVRSTDGLLIHCLGKLTFALLLLNFYY